MTAQYSVRDGVAVVGFMLARLGEPSAKQGDGVAIGDRVSRLFRFHLSVPIDLYDWTGACAPLGP